MVTTDPKRCKKKAKPRTKETHWFKVNAKWDGCNQLIWAPVKKSLNDHLKLRHFFLCCNVFWSRSVVSFLWRPCGGGVHIFVFLLCMCVSVLRCPVIIDAVCNGVGCIELCTVQRAADDVCLDWWRHYLLDATAACDEHTIQLSFTHRAVQHTVAIV